MKRLYLDANGSCPPIREAKEALLRLLNCVGNPSSFHEEGRTLRMAIDEAREQVSKALSVGFKEVVFTSGASEANRWFVDALVNNSLILIKKPLVVMSPFEHPSLFKPMVAAHDLNYINLFIIKVNGLGQLEFAEDQLRACDVLVMCQAHNETGIIPDIAKALSFIRSDTIVMSDIAQGFARLPPPLDRVDFATFSAQKMGGYAGAGGFFIRGNGKTLTSPWLGGSQENGFRPGTEGVLAIAALGAAASKSEEIRKSYRAQELWRNAFEADIKKIAPVRIIGEELARLPNTSAICFLKENPDALRIACDVHGLSVGFGSACSGLAPTPSFFLAKLGLDLTLQKTCVRFSFPPDLSKADLLETKARLMNKILSHKLPV
jgi:cysteine desulfurase